MAMQNYEAFVATVLDRLPEQELTDLNYNQLVRHSRYDAWNRAAAATNYYKAATDFYFASAVYYGNVEVNSTLRPASESERQEAVNQWRAAVAQQILTPSYNRECVTWKLRAAKRGFLPISDEKIKDAIAADEAFLSAHPLKRCPRR
jgi:hypothetical protein